MSETMRFEVHVSDVVKVNPLFSKCKINVCYHGLNRNNSDISKELINSRVGTIFNIPIIGEYLYETDNFGGHGGKLEITDEGARFIQTAIPFGVVPESATVYWENITEKNGLVREYLVVDGAYLWTGRYPEVESLVGTEYGQSMEIEIMKGAFKQKNGETVYEVQDFAFSALCILGISKESDPYGHVEPCFESASIVAYSLDKDQFTKEFNAMINELKFSLSEQGGNEMEDTQLESAETVEEKETEEVVEEQTTQVDQPEEQSVEEKEPTEETEKEVEEDEKEESEVETEEKAETEQVEESAVDYELIIEQLRNEVAEFKKLIETKDSNYAVLKAEFDELKTKYDSVLDKYTSMKQQERLEQETELFNSFSKELTEEEIAPIKETKGNYTIDELTTQLYTLVGKKKAKFTSTQKKKYIDIEDQEPAKKHKKGKSYDYMFE